jgi:hypothetical protein
MERKIRDQIRKSAEMITHCRNDITRKRTIRETADDADDNSGRESVYVWRIK